MHGTGTVPVRFCIMHANPATYLPRMNLKNITLIALAASCCLQVGAQLFAVSMVASTLAAAPPRSMAMLQGEYGYNSSAFWNIVPTITLALFIVGLIANWKTPRCKLILFSLGLFIPAGLLAGVLVEPMFDEIKAAGFSSEVDAALKEKADTWYLLDWLMWSLGLLAALSLLLALTKPVRPVSNTTIA